MPPVIAAGAAGALAFASEITILGLSVGLSAVVIAGAGLALSLINSAIFPVETPAFPAFSVEARERTLLARTTALPRTLIFGEAMIAGPLPLFESTGSSKEFLHVVVPHGDHPSDAIVAWLVNEEAVGAIDGGGNVTGGRFAGHLRLTAHLGAFDQAADGDLVSEVANWTVAHKGGGITYTAARLKWNLDVWPNSFSNLKAQVRGVPLHDPRDAGATLTTSNAADPAVFNTSVAHGFAAGGYVWIKGHGAAVPAVAKMHQVATVPTTTTFTLIDQDGASVALTTGGSGGTASKMLWSDNWALCVRHWLTHRDGFNLADSELDDTALGAAANICDEQVTLAAEAETFTADTVADTLALANSRAWKTGDVVRVSTTASLPSPLAAATDYYAIRVDKATVKLATTLSGARARAAIDITTAGSGTHTATRDSQLRYTCNGVITLGQGPLATLDSLMTAAAGVVVYSGGTFQVYAGAAVSSSANVGETDLRAGDLEVLPSLPRDQVFNAARGTFVDPDKFWTRGDIAPATNATYQAEDGERIYRDFEFPFTTDPVAGQRLLKIALERARQGAALTWPAKPRRFATAVWDVESVTLDHLGYAAKQFRVLGWSENQDQGIDITYREEAAEVWDWNLGDETIVDFAPNSNLPDPFTVAPPGAPELSEVTYQTRDGGGVKVKAVLSWVASADAFLKAYQPEYKLASASEWTILPRTPDATIEILDIAPGLYDFRVKALNELGVASDYSTTSNREIFGLLAPPAVPANLTLVAVGGMALLRWDRHPDLDVRIGGRIAFRHSQAQSGATWQTSVSIGDPVDGADTVVVLPLKPGTYLAKAIDSSGVPSATAASAATKGAQVLAFANLNTINEHTTFVGTHSSTVADSGVLKLVGTGSFDAIPDLDLVVDLDAGSGIASSGTYDFAAGIDLGSVKLTRLRSNLTVTIINVLDKIDDRTGLLDDWEDFDGSVAGSGDAQVWARETDDDPASSPTWSAWHRLDAAEYQARGFDFQARLSVDDPAYNIQVSALTVTADEVV